MWISVGRCGIIGGMSITGLEQSCEPLTMGEAPQKLYRWLQAVQIT